MTQESHPASRAGRSKASSSEASPHEALSQANSKICLLRKAPRKREDGVSSYELRAALLNEHPKIRCILINVG